jgi:subtilisin family serine protease
LKTRKVLGEYDWIFKDDSTNNQAAPNQFPDDAFDQDEHGTSTFSTLAGYYPGQIIGPAFDAEFYLSKTEDDATETPVEEDYYVEAVEWMEAMGVEVISCSLIYKPYDPPNNSYSYKDMDGKTTIIARSANIAASLGIVIVNSMGNEYQTDPPSIVSPPDADNVIAVGAVDSTGEIAMFSSNGPSSDGRIKPDVVAMGVDVYTASSMTATAADSIYSYSSGTSFSSPLTSGVCALILSAHPELTPDQVKEALKMTANNKDKPNNIYGWGLINAYEAALYYGMFMSNKPEIKESDGKTEITIYAVSKNTINESGVNIVYTVGGESKTLSMELVDKVNETNTGRYTAILPFEVSSAPVTFYFSASDTKGTVTVPYNAPSKFFYYNPDSKGIEIF